MGSIDAKILQRQMGRATSMWRSIVAQVPTLIGKLLWVSSFRDSHTDDYRHPALDQMFSPQVSRAVLEESHRRYFDDWLALGLQKQHDDFVEYVENLRLVGDPKHFLNNVGERLIPRSAVKPERLLFETDLAVVLELLD